MNEKQIGSKRQKKILFTCLGISFAIHLTMLGVFYKNPPSYLSGISALFNKNRTHLEHATVKTTKDAILEEVFQEFTLLPAQSITLFDKEKTAPLCQVKPLVEEVKEPYLLTPSLFAEEDSTTLELAITPMDQEEPLLEKSPSPHSAPFYTPPLATQKTLSAPLSQLGIAIEPFTDESLSHYSSSHALPENALLIGQSLGVSSLTEKELTLPSLVGLETSSTDPLIPSYKHPLLIFRSLNDPVAHWQVKDDLKRELPKLSDYKMPETLYLVDWEAYFHLETQVMEDPEGEGYIFSIHLKPRQSLDAKKIPHNITFLIDRSNSIDKHYYEAFKKAVLRSLHYLKKGDTFNIALLDKKIYRLSPQPLPISKQTVHYAKKFLQEQSSGGLFTATEIYPMIEKALPSECPKNSMNSVFILSDGNTLFNTKKQQAAIHRILKKNNEICTLHTAAAGSGNNIVLLDLLSSANKGSFCYSTTYAAFPRKFVSQVMRVSTPLLQEISLKCKKTSDKVLVELYPSSLSTPAIYQDLPYTILGRIDKLADFTLLIEGKNQEQWISIEKEISLTKAKKATALLEKKWALQETRFCYDRFLRNAKPQFLKTAEEALKIHGEIHH